MRRFVRVIAIVLGAVLGVPLFVPGSRRIRGEQEEKENNTVFQLLGLLLCPEWKTLYFLKNMRGIMLLHLLPGVERKKKCLRVLNCLVFNPKSDFVKNKENSEGKKKKKKKKKNFWGKKKKKKKKKK